VGLALEQTVVGGIDPTVNESSERAHRWSSTGPEIRKRGRWRRHERAEHPPKRVPLKLSYRTSVLRDNQRSTLSCDKTRWPPIPSIPESFPGFLSDTAAPRRTIRRSLSSVPRGNTLATVRSGRLRRC